MSSDSHPRREEALLKGANRGDPEAQFEFARLLLARGREFEGLDWCRRAGGNGHIPAAVLAGQMLMMVGERAELLAEAVDLFTRAERAGHPEAPYLLALLALGDNVLPRDFGIINRRMKTSAQQGHAPAQRALALYSGRFSETADGVPAFEKMLDFPAPVTMCTKPHVRIIDGLLTSAECRYFIEAARPHLRRSRTYDPRTRQLAKMQVRTSSDATIGINLEDFALRLLQLRMAKSAEHELVDAEELIVLHYLPGEQYHPHCDYLPDSALRERRYHAGQRRTTVFVYLSPVEAGGETAFPRLGGTIQPVRGRAVIFDNLHADGTPDPQTQHAGLPVGRGEKWLATLWLRQRPFRFY